MIGSNDAAPVFSSVQKHGLEPGTQEEIVSKMYEIYNDAIKPVEDMYNYRDIDPHPFSDAVKNERPFVSFFGPWSSGKSTFINYLLQENHLWTGQHPTTSEFTVVMYGDEPREVDGAALIHSKDLPFSGLNRFGEAFLNAFKGFQAPHPLLKRITMVDTPGVLESADDAHSRKYDYIGVSQWFAQRSDIIYFLFDPTKLDAGPELQAMFKTAFKGCEKKVRIVLNKADSVTSQELYRVYGSLFWNLSSFLSNTEPPRVYVGSFWDQPYKEGTFTLLFSEEKGDLITELTDVLPQHSRDKKIYSVLQRARHVHAHAMVVGEVKGSLPPVFGRSKATKKSIEELPTTYERLAKEFNMNASDFPDKKLYSEFFEKNDPNSFNSRATAEKSGRIKKLREVIQTTLPGYLHPVKKAKQADVRDKAETRRISTIFTEKIQQQYEGQPGTLGASDTTARRTSVINQGQRGTLQPYEAQNNGGNGMFGFSSQAGGFAQPVLTNTISNVGANNNNNNNNSSTTNPITANSSYGAMPNPHEIPRSAPYQTESEDDAAPSDESNAQMLAMMQQLMAQQQEQQRQNRELNERQQQEFQEKLRQLQEQNAQLSTQQQKELQERLLEMNQQQQQQQQQLLLANEAYNSSAKKARSGSGADTPPSTIFVEPPPGVFDPEEEPAPEPQPEAIDKEEDEETKAAEEKPTVPTLSSQQYTPASTSKKKK